MTTKVRLFVEHPLSEAQPVPLTRDQAHYLFGVMRLRPGQQITVFNGADGAWSAQVEEAGKRVGLVRCTTQSAAQTDPPDLWLCFAPLKKARTDFVVEKAVELGVRRLQPVVTEFTNSERVRVDRLQAHAIEAAEQCGATFVPLVADPVKFDHLLSGWEPARTLIFCDETRATKGLPPVAAPAAILIGPEGGFSETERARLHALPFVAPATLGPRILRAETAALAALTLWQAQSGDWR